MINDRKGEGCPKAAFFYNVWKIQITDQNDSLRPVDYDATKKLYFCKRKRGQAWSFMSVVSVYEEIRISNTLRCR